MGMPLELKELLHNLKDRNWDVNPVYQIDENEARKIIKALEQEPFINKPCVSSGVCEHDKNKVLDKIKNGMIVLMRFCRLSTSTKKVRKYYEKRRSERSN